MKNLFLCLFSMVSLAAHAQQTPEEKARLYTASAGLFSQKIQELDSKLKGMLAADTKAVMSPFVINRFIENKFTYLSFNRSELPTGNSAALDIADNSTSLKLTLSKKIQNEGERIKAIITGGVKAKLGDGIAELFRGNSASAGTSFFGNISILGNSRFVTSKSEFENGQRIPSAAIAKLSRKLTRYYNSNFYDKYVRALQDNKYPALISRLRQIETQLAETPRDCCTEIAAVQQRLKAVRDSLSSLPGKTKAEEAAIVLLEVQLQKQQADLCACSQTADASVTKLYNEKESIEKQLSETGITDAGVDEAADKIEKNYLEDYYKAITGKPVWEKYQLRWFSFAITYSKNQYALYNGALPVSKRFTSKDFDAFGLKMSYNWFQQNINQPGFVRSWYAGITYEPELTNNYESLSPKDMLKNVVLGSNIDTTILSQTAKKARDITGIAFKKILQHGFSASYTAMFTKKSNVGINLLAQSRFSDAGSPAFNSRLGVIVSMANSDFDPDDKKSKAQVNFEVFVQFPDMTDTGKTGKSVWQNKVIGISTNIPFNKIFLK
ncbi:MAG: hypothetical protein U0X40_01850 [Ferruginibacter sp.]